MYRVNEIFYSLQGEGIYAGTPAVFVRFSGCNRHCDYCDTLHGEYTEMTLEQITAEVQKYPSRHVVLTGGEPTLQIDSALVKVLKSMGNFVQIETNGTRTVPDEVDWVTCSPKAQPWGIQRVDELKVVYTGQNVEEIATHFTPKVMCLQPCSCQNIPETIDYILIHPWWRLSLQTHKILDIK